MTDEEKERIYREFNEAVNMAPKELESWLATGDSQSVGQKPGGGESVGHASGRRIVEIKHTRKGELSEDDYAHMRKVIGYVHRHAAQPPQGDPRHTRWRYSLMNWGHDPLKR